MMTGVVAAAVAASVATWNFDGGTDGWTPNAHITNLVARDGTLRGTTIDRDPILFRRDMNLRATPWQYVVLRMRSSRDGSGELFWTGETTGKYGGFSTEKITPFRIQAGTTFQDIVLVPFWQGERTIRQLRLDLIDGTDFEIDSIRIAEWGGGATPQTNAFEWTFGADLAAWRPHPAAEDLYDTAMDGPF